MCWGTRAFSSIGRVQPTRHGIFVSFHPKRIPNCHLFQSQPCVKRRQKSYPPKLLSGFFEGDVFHGFYHGIHHHFFHHPLGQYYFKNSFQASSPVANPTIFPNFSPEKSEPFFQGKISHLLRRGIEGNMPIITQLIEAKVPLVTAVYAFCLGVQYTLLGGRKRPHHAY